MIKSILWVYSDRRGIYLGGETMDILRTIVTIIYIIICVALTVIVLMQEGKQAEAPKEQAAG